MAAPHVEITSKVLIKPSNPTPHALKQLQFSYLDQVAAKIYIPLIFFYQNQPSSDIDNIKRSQMLKQSLSNVLTKFYPLAGRINGDISINCNDSGVVYVEARVHAFLSQAMQNGTLEDLNMYLPIDPCDIGKNQMCSADVPLAIQANVFECGGTAIGVCFSHTVGDVCSLVTFMNAWAATCRGETAILQPIFDLGFQHFPPIEIAAASVTSPEQSTEKKFVTKRFVFDKQKLSAIKELASSASDGSQVQNPTRVEAVSAFIWKHTIDMAQTKADTKIKFAAAHAVNFRPRMNPPLPDFVMGNFSIDTAVSFVLHKDNEYHNLAGLLGNQIRKIKNVENGADYISNMSKFKEMFAMPEMRLCFITSWCRFPTYEVNYGWGKPFWVSTITFSYPCVILMSTRSGDGIEAWIGMEEDESSMLPTEFVSLERIVLGPHA